MYRSSAVPFSCITTIHFDDKGLYRFLLNGYNIPTRVAECNNGIYYLPNQEGPCEIEKESFLKKLENVDNCIIKPSKGTDGGRGVCSFRLQRA